MRGVFEDPVVMVCPDCGTDEIHETGIRMVNDTTDTTWHGQYWCTWCDFDNGVEIVPITIDQWRKDNGQEEGTGD